MKQVGMAIILFASFCCAQEAGDFQPSSTNVWAAEYPRVDSAGRAQIRVKAPDASKAILPSATTTFTFSNPASSRSRKVEQAASSVGKGLLSGGAQRTAAVM